MLFSRVSHKYFSGVGKSGEISFYLLKTEKTTFLTKNLVGIQEDFKIQEGQGFPLPFPSDANDQCSHQENFALQLCNHVDTLPVKR